MFGSDAVNGTAKVHLSDNVISSCIDDMSADIEVVAEEIIKLSRKFALLLNESKDISDHA